MDYHKLNQRGESYSSSWQASRTRSLSYIRGISSLQPCVKSVCKDLSHLSLPRGIILVPYIGDMLIGSNVQEAATTLDLLVRHLFVWDISLTNLQGLCLTEMSRGPVVWDSRYPF